MATGTLATDARKYHHDMVHYASVPIVYTTAGAYKICKLPAGAAVINAGIVITTAFAGGTPQTLDIGVTGDTADYASALVLTTKGVIKADDMATSTSSYQSADTDAVATLSAGATPSAGAGYAYVVYIIADRTP